MANDYEDDIDMDEEETIYTDDDSDDSSIGDIVEQIKEYRDEKKKSSDDTPKDKNPDNSSKSSNDNASTNRKDTNKTSKDAPKSPTSDVTPSTPSKMDAVSSGGKTIGSGLNTLSSAQRAKEAADEGDYGEAVKSGLETAHNAKDTVESAKKTADTWNQMKTASDTAKIGSTATTTGTTAAGGATAVGGTAGTAAGSAAAGSAAAGGAAAGAGAGAGSAVAAGGPYVWIAIAIIAVVILLVILITSVAVCSISATASAAAVIDEKTNPDNMSTNSFISDQYFYGLRTVYVDDNELSNSLQLSYKQYVIDIVTNIDENNSDATINIILPSTSIDNSSVIDNHIVNMSLGIGNIVATGTAEYLDVDFASLYPQIAYFGITLEQSEIINSFITDYIKSNDLILLDGGSVDQLIDSAMSHTDLQYIFNLCEKVMIKDEIATADGISGLTQRKYLASIYMPCRNITITTSCHIVSTDSNIYENHIKLIEKNNNNEQVYIDDEITETPYVQDGISQLNRVTLQQFNSIDNQNLDAFSVGVSLFDAIKMSSNYSAYFTKDITTNIYTWKPTDSHYLYLEFDPSDIFIYGEFDLSVLWAD